MEGIGSLMISRFVKVFISSTSDGPDADRLRVPRRPRDGRGPGRTQHVSDEGGSLSEGSVNPRRGGLRRFDSRPAAAIVVFVLEDG